MSKVSLVQPMEELDDGDDGLLTAGMLQEALPRKARGRLKVPDDFLARVNGILANSQDREEYRSNLLAYTSVLSEGRYTIEAYANAVRYVSFKLKGDTNLMAYVKTFPKRYQSFLDNQWADKDINSTISGYHRTQLVTKIMEASLVPSWILNQDLYQKALNESAWLMTNARSEKVRCDAANNLLSHLKMPETQKVELDVNVKEDDSINELRKVTMDLVAQQKRMIEAGAMTAGDVAKQKVVNGQRMDEVVSEQ